MSLFSFFKEEKILKCDWCKKEIEEPTCVKFVGQKKYNFCSESCKKNFRKYSNENKVSSCPTCALRR